MPEWMLAVYLGAAFTYGLDGCAPGTETIGLAECSNDRRLPGHRGGDAPDSPPGRDRRPADPPGRGGVVVGTP